MAMTPVYCTQQVTFHPGSSHVPCSTVRTDSAGAGGGRLLDGAMGLRPEGSTTCLAQWLHSQLYMRID